jgi:hypothetical protein
MADGVGPRAYYSERHGRRAQPLTAEQARSLFANFVGELESAGDLQEWFGYECVDAYNRVPGRLGSAVGDRLSLRLHHDNVWPLTAAVISQWDDNTLFDMIEFLYDHVSRGDRESGRLHDFSDCGWHFNTFTTQPARDEYRLRVNEILARVDNGYELDDVGHVVHLPPTGLEPLLSASLPGLDETNTEHVASAIEKFQLRPAEWCTDPGERVALR